jgi:hypothetical protein
MVIKSVPLDDMNTIVFAIRGTQNFRDWAVNMQTEPKSPQGFLDDPGNLCHAGFLSVARKMIRPVASRLQELLQENPNRSSCSLIITGHSAGGAVASLLYCHMLSQSVESELTLLCGDFKRVHCITFGAPPVSLLPLEKPSSAAYRKSLFFSFINEGDPVPRADRAYVLSLLELYACPAPGSALAHLKPLIPNNHSTTKIAQSKKKPTAVRWKLPTTYLSTAGRLVILRPLPRKKSSRDRDYSSSSAIEACVTTDAELRDVVFGDPMVHAMDLYARRIETLATNAVTARLSTE